MCFAWREDAVLILESSQDDIVVGIVVVRLEQADRA
jgi:hypothetical protein